MLYVLCYCLRLLFLFVYCFVVEHVDLLVLVFIWCVTCCVVVLSD